jgi:tRNA-2-methylthio-N6-dimethylallyladenosine synthase
MLFSVGSRVWMQGQEGPLPRTSKNMRQRKVFIKTYGCQMNDLDSQFIMGDLIARGFGEANDESEADIVLLNTCCVRGMAERKALGKMQLLGQLKESNPDLILGICGCMAQNRKGELLKELPFLDIVCGPSHIGQLGEMIDSVLERRVRKLHVEEDVEEEIDFGVARRGSRLKAFVSIMRGCDNYCSYCIVPYVRGREHSRRPQAILEEIKRLAGRGYKEVTLLGQNVNSYGKGLEENCDLVGLLEGVNEIEGIERIRFVTSHPKDISPRLIKAMAELEKVCEQLHFPLQSGSDRILRRMNRGYTLADYLRIVDSLRAAVPGIALATDIIVGFPGETEREFMETVEAMRRIEYDSAFIFKYSTREGTEAAKLADDVPLTEKKKRNKILLEQQEEVSLRKNRALIGTEVEVLVEGVSKRNARRMMGRTRRNRIAVFEGKPDIIGQILKRRVVGATALTLFCEEPKESGARLAKGTGRKQTTETALSMNERG